MNDVFVSFEQPGNTDRNTDLLTEFVRERFSETAGHFTGYRFLYDFEGEEQILCRGWSPKAADALLLVHCCWCTAAGALLLVQATLSWERVRLFRNANHELAIQIVDPTLRSVRERFTNNNLPVTVLL